MRRLVTVVICIALLVMAAPAAAGPPLQLPALTRIASRLSGLRAQMHVHVVVLRRTGMRRQALRLLDREYPPDQQAYDETVDHALGVLSATESLRPSLEHQAATALGLYDPQSRTLYVRAGATQKRALLHELVHALQDQTFNLQRLASLRRGEHDAARAAAAAVEGHAEFVTQVLGGAVAVRSRALSASGASTIRNFLELENEFPYTTGLRFITTLHNLGGNAAVFSALRRFPTTTEQIFHVDAFLTPERALPIALPGVAGEFGLIRQDTFGELDVRALLAVFSVPRLDRVGEGWGGGRTAVYEDASGRRAVAVRLDWDTQLDAAEWTEAVETYVNEAFDADSPGFPATTPCAADLCWNVGGRSLAFVRHATRTALVFGPNVPASAALADAVSEG